MNASKSTLRYKKWIILVSITIPVVVAFLFRIRLENIQSLSFLPPIYASVNGYTAIILLVALWAIKNRKINLHEQMMKTCMHKCVDKLHICSQTRLKSRAKIIKQRQLNQKGRHQL